MKFNNKGITLIALIITIIVLLILAGVSISTIIGDNGVLSQANKSKIETNHSTVKEFIDIEASSFSIEKQTGEYSGTVLNYLMENGIIDENNIINVEKLLGKTLSTGNRSGTSDVYKIIEAGTVSGSSVTDITKMENKIYKIVYYPSDYQDENDIVDLGELYDSIIVVATENILIVENGIVTGVSEDYLSAGTGGTCFTSKLIDERLVSFEIPSELNGQEVISIGENAFAGIRNLKSVKLPNTITTIGKMAFGECISLEKVDGVENVKVIEEGAFGHCYSLESIKLSSLI